MTALLTTLTLQIASNITGNMTTGLSPTLSDLGYVQFPDVLYAAYKFHEELATWNEARERCMSEGGHLAIADSPIKIAHIRSMKNHSDHWLHVGIYKIVGTSQWARFDNGLPVSPVPWAYDNADRVGSCTGISMFADGLVDYPCTGKQEYFVCEIRITGDDNGTESSVPDSGLVPSQSTPRNRTSTLPDGYIAYPDVGAAYKVVYDNVTWIRAKNLCSNEGAQLALIDSVKKINYVMGNLTLTSTGTGAHVGIYLSIRKTELKWVSVRDGAVVESLPWQSDAYSRDKGCARLDFDLRVFYAWYCNDPPTTGYICELRIPTS